MANYEEPTLEYDNDGNDGDLIQPMCCNVAVVGVIYVAVAIADAAVGANWVAAANGIAYVNAGVKAC